MKPSHLLLAIVTLALLFTFAVPTAHASTAKPPAAPVVVDPRKLIKSVDVAGSAVVIEFMRDKTMHSYKIDDFTVLKVNNVKGAIAQIKPGMEVEDYVERDDQTLDGLSLSGYGTDPAAAAKPKATTKPKPSAKPPAQT